MKKKLTINIQNLEFKCIIGILDFEREKKQRVNINISFDYIFSEKYFIDYSEVSNLVKKIMKKEKFLLIEDAIIHIDKLLQKKYKINNLKIIIAKPDILDDCVVSLSL